MRLHTTEGSSKRTIATSPAVTNTSQWHNGTADSDSETDPQAQLLAALAANAKRLTGTTGLTRQTQLLDRARLWEDLAQIATPALTQVYRKVALVCRQEADTLGTSTHSDLHDGWGEKAA